jgi:hypothetical protein
MYFSSQSSIDATAVLTVVKGVQTFQYAVRTTYNGLCVDWISFKFD